MKLKIMSYNVLCYGRDGFFWTDRKDMVTDILNREHPDSFGLQESHYDWMKVVCAAMPDYAYVGAGRDDGKTDGEFSPVFYLKDKFELLDSGTFWLSETPDRVSRGWDGVCRRVCSWAKLKDKESGSVYVHMNTHLDHRGPVARTNGLAQLLDFAERFSEPVVLTGDFNFEEGCELYKQMTSGLLRDSKYAAKEILSEGVTYTGFYPLIKDNDPPQIIDYINVSDGIKVDTYRVIDDKPNGKFPSDHYPVEAEIEI